MSMYGKRIIHESVFDDNVQPKKVWDEVSISIPDKEHLLTEVLECLDLIIGNQTDDLTITIKRNKIGQIRLVKTHRVS